MRTIKPVFYAVFIAAVLTAGAHAAPLYDALGGAGGVHCIVARTLELSQHDPRIAAKFDDTNMHRLQRKIIEQICDLSGGPCHYGGHPMRKAHAALHLTDFHFNALVEDLESAMGSCNVPFRDQNRLLALLAPMRRDVVSR